MKHCLAIDRMELAPALNIGVDPEGCTKISNLVPIDGCQHPADSDECSSSSAVKPTAVLS